MINAKGFWSYVHDDDDAEGERISRLAKDVTAQYQMLTGETIELFLDIETLKWGEDWQETVNSNLATVAFFIPVMTPRYFMSAECRRELQFFARRATNLGIEELILPLYYVTVPAIENRTVTDDLVELARKFHWEDWRELRFLEVSSERYRRGVAKLAELLGDANRRIEEAAAISTPQEIEESTNEMGVAKLAELLGDANRHIEEAAATSTPQEIEESTNETDEAPGMIDKLADSEEKLLMWPKTLEELRENIELIGQIMKESTEKINKANAQGKGFSVRLLIIRETAHHLQEPTDRIWKLSNDFVSLVYDVDVGIRIIIEKAPEEISDNPNAMENFCTMFRNIYTLADSWHFALDATENMNASIEPVEKMSRDLRPVVRRLRQGLTLMTETRQVIDDWINLIDSTGIECEDVDEQSIAE